MNSFDLTLPTNTTTLEPPVKEPKRPLLTPLPDDDYLLVLDNTASEKIVTCPRSAEWYLVQGREAHAKSASLSFGGALHEGLEAYYQGKSDIEQNAAVVKYFTENPTPPDEYRTLGNALEVLRLYRQECAIREDYKWELLKDGDHPIIERPFELPLGVIPLETEIKLPKWDAPRYIRQIHVAWSGRIDLVVSVQATSYVNDHKTTSIGDEKFIQDFQLSNQTLGYVWAGRKLWPYHNIKGFCLNAIWFKKPTGAGPLNERGPRGGEPALKFFRSYFTYSEEMLEQWAFNALTIVGDFVHNLVRDYHPLHTKWCFGKYGRCQYHDVCCLQDPAIRLRYLQSEVFKDVTWDPVNH